MKIRILLLAIFFTAQVSAWAEHNTDGLDCDGTQIEMNFCASALNQHAVDELNALYDEQFNRLASEEAKTNFEEAQRAWLIFQEKSCQYEWPDGRHGTSRPMVLNHCEEYYARQRIEDLKRHLKCTDNGCPY